MSDIYDPLRRKWVARTPEEEVRQRVIAWLRDVKIDGKVITQIVRYTRVLAVRYIIVTNGTTTHVLERRTDGSGYDYLERMPEKLL